MLCKFSISKMKKNSGNLDINGLLLMIDKKRIEIFRFFIHYICNNHLNISKDV